MKYIKDAVESISNVCALNLIMHLLQLSSQGRPEAAGGSRRPMESESTCCTWRART